MRERGQSARPARNRRQALYVPAGEGASVDGLAVDLGSHVAVFWTGVVDGMRAVVALDLHPRPSEGLDGLRWLDDRRRQLDAGPLAVVSADLLRSLSIGDAMERRGALSEAAGVARDLRSQLGAQRWASVLSTLSASSRGEGGDFADHPSVTDPRKCEYFTDALYYVQALEAGDSPRVVIARQRQIAEQTADRRIRMARQHGFLTEAAPGQRRAGGALTPLGEYMRERLEDGLRVATSSPEYADGASRSRKKGNS